MKYALYIWDRDEFESIKSFMKKSSKQVIWKLWKKEYEMNEWCQSTLMLLAKGFVSSTVLQQIPSELQWSCCLQIGSSFSFHLLLSLPSLSPLKLSSSSSHRRILFLCVFFLPPIAPSPLRCSSSSFAESLSLSSPFLSSARVIRRWWSCNWVSKWI